MTIRRDGPLGSDILAWISAKIGPLMAEEATYVVYGDAAGGSV